jgi:hypothetical protein
MQKKVETDQTKIEQLTKLKDIALEMQWDDETEGDAIAPGKRRFEVGDPEEDIVIVTYPKGHMAITKAAYQELGAPTYVEVCVRGDITCIRPRKTQIRTACTITNADLYPTENLYRFSNTPYLRKISAFGEHRYYFYGYKTKEGWIIFDHTMPCHVVKGDE